MKVIKRITSVVLTLILCFGFAATCMADTILSTQQAALSKIAPEIMQAFEAGDKKVPVYIWLTDINQDSVEKEVEQKTGLTRDTLSVSTETISAELATAITNESTKGFSEKTTTEFNSYLERTAQARELERINTDTYISERRAIARSKIEAKNTAFVTSAEISESSIIFQSAYAPMIIAELSEYQVQMLAGRMDVVKMAKYEEQKIATDSILTGSNTVDPQDMQTWQNNVGLSKVRQMFGLTGAGVKIGIVEKALVPTDIDELPSERFIAVQSAGNYDPVSLTHARYIAQLYAGEQGIAKDATVYCVAWESGETYGQEVEKLLEQNVKVINTSAGSSPRDSAYTFTEQYVDYIVFTHNVVIVKSGGNYFNEPISSPGNAYNIITVGGMNDSFTADIGDDEMCAYSFDETVGGCMKPDVVASAITPWDDEDSDYAGKAAGTSAAAPIVSGYIALMLELQPALVERPEVVKAIVLASCHRKVAPATVDDDLPEQMTEGITNKQGGRRV